MGISVGVVGVGMFGQSFVRLFRDHPLVDRIALCDIDGGKLSRAAKRFCIGETYDSLEAICRTDIQALAIITQPWLHAPQAVTAMEHGKHVYSAVPLICLDNGDENLQWVDKVISTCRKTGMHYMMGETSYYRPQAMYCRRQAAAGAFGRFVMAEGEYFHDMMEPTCPLRPIIMERWGKDWSEQKRGSIPMHYPTHSIGGLLSVMKNVRMTEVCCFGYEHPNEDWFLRDTEVGNPYSNETALFRLSNGGTARICEYRRVGHSAFEGFRIYGTEGSFTAGPREDQCQWVTRQGPAPLTIEQMRDPLPPDVYAAFSRESSSDADVYGSHGGSHAYLVHEFVESVHQNRPPAINAWVSARYFVPGVMAHKSAVRDGELLKIPDWGDGPVV